MITTSTLGEHAVSSASKGLQGPSHGAWLLRVTLALVALLAAIAARASTFDLPAQGDIIGEVRSVVSTRDDTLADIARRYDLGYDQIVRANPGVDPWVPGEGTRIVLPTQFILPDAPREGIVLNLAEMRLYYYPKAQAGGTRTVITHPVGIGREGWNTPLGKTEVVRKEANPSWYPPEAIRKEHAADGDILPPAVPPGPDNPLGQFAMYLGFKGYLIHGTDKAYGIGMRVSHGCMRLYPEDIASLFVKVPLKTPVYVVDQPFKAGWHGDRLYLEAHPALSDREDTPQNTSLTPLVRAIVRKVNDAEDGVSWDRAMAVASDPRGMPVSIMAGAGAPERPAAPVPALAPAAAPAGLPMPAQGVAYVPALPPSPEMGVQVPASQEGAGSWFVQVGAFRRPDNAERLAERLQNLAPPVPALHSARDGIYRVIAGPFGDRAAADVVARRITSYFQVETRVLSPRAVTSTQ